MAYKWFVNQTPFSAPNLIPLQPVIAIQTCLPEEDVAIATAVLVFAQYMGSAIYLSVCNTLFSTSLTEKLAEEAPSMNADLIIASGATAFRTIVPEALLPAVLRAYVESIDLTFYVAVGLGAVAFAAAWGMGWIDTKETSKVPGGERHSLIVELEDWRRLDDYTYSETAAWDAATPGRRTRSLRAEAVR